MGDVQKKVDEWNAKYPVGTTVDVYLCARPLEDLKGRFKTRSEAWAMGGHTAVVMIEGVFGAWELEAMKPIVPQYSASTSDTWCEPCNSEEGAIDEAVRYWWDSYADEDDNEIEVEVGEAEPRQPADHVCGASVIYNLLERSYGHAPERYRPIPRNHRDSRGLRCVDPELVKSMAEDLEPALREVLRTWWEKHDLPTWFEVPGRTRTVKVRVKVDEGGDLDGWEVVE